VREAEHTERTGPPPVTSMPTPPERSLSPRDLYLPAVVVDARDEAAANPDYEVSVSDLQDFEDRYGRIPHNAAVIAWIGRGRKRGTPAYFGYDEGGNVHQPGSPLHRCGDCWRRTG